MQNVINGSTLLNNIVSLSTISALQSNTTISGGYVYINNIGFYFGDPTLSGLTATSNNSIVVDKNGTRWIFQPQLDILTSNDIFPNDPKYYGATGNGVTDDTVALQNWINYLQTVKVVGHLSAGTYNITNNLTVSSPVSIYGDGADNSIISNGNTALTGAIFNITSSLFDGYLKDFQITSAAVNTSLNAITFNNPSENFIISGLIITNLYDGIYFAATQYGGVVKDVIVQNCVNGFVVDAGNLSMSNCYASDNSHYGFYFSSVSGQSAGLTLTNLTSFNNTLGNMYFLGNTTYGIYDVTADNLVCGTSASGYGINLDTYGNGHNFNNIYSEFASELINITANNADINLSNVVLRGNASTTDGIVILGGSNYNITSVSAQAIVSNSIYITGGSNIIISNSNVGGAAYGINLTGVAGFILQNNVFSGTTANTVINTNTGVQKIQGNIGLSDNGFAYAAGNTTAVTTTSTTYVMTGFGVIYTPVKTGNVRVRVLCLVNNDTAADVTYTETTYQAGTALIAEGTAVSGTVVPNMTDSITAAAASALQSVGQEQVLTGLTLGTSYIFETALAASAGTAGYYFKYMEVQELG